MSEKRVVELSAQSDEMDSLELPHPLVSPAGLAKDVQLLGAIDQNRGSPSQLNLK